MSTSKRDMLRCLSDIMGRVRRGEIVAVCACGIPADGEDGVITAVGEATEDQWNDAVDELAEAVTYDGDASMIPEGDDHEVN